MSIFFGGALAGGLAASGRAGADVEMRACEGEAVAQQGARRATVTVKIKCQ
jgi:hypothetical protein